MILAEPKSRNSEIGFHQLGFHERHLDFLGSSAIKTIGKKKNTGHGILLLSFLKNIKSRCHSCVNVGASSISNALNFGQKELTVLLSIPEERGQLLCLIVKGDQTNPIILVSELQYTFESVPHQLHFLSSHASATINHAHHINRSSLALLLLSELLGFEIDEDGYSLLVLGV